MAYDWRPTGSRSVTTGSSPVVAPPTAVTMAAAIEDFIEAAEQGSAVNRSGRRYRPSALRDVKGILRFHVAPALGERPVNEVRRADIQALVDSLRRERLSESRIRSVISALRALYAYAIDKRYVEFNPADSLTMPAIPEDDPSEDDGAPPRGGDTDEYRPIAVLPERLLSLALRAALVVFAIVAILSIVQPA
jgi:site-specific recombinase XerC